MNGSGSVQMQCVSRICMDFANRIPGFRVVLLWFEDPLRDPRHYIGSYRAFPRVLREPCRV